MRALVALCMAGVLVAACGASSAPSVASIPSPSREPSAAGIAGFYSVDGHDEWIGCQGDGPETVIFEAGLGAGGFIWSSVADQLASTTRVCTYDRAGVGSSRQRPGNPPTSAGAMAREAWALFQAAGLRGPLVLVGHSFGGLIVQLVAAGHPEAVRGVVLVDSSSRHQFEGEWLKNDGEWIDNSSPVDRVASARELATVTSLGSIPLAVLTQGQINGDFEIDWSHFQDELAALSSNSLHMVAHDSGHEIMKDDPELIVETTKAVLDATNRKTALPGCGRRFESLGAECLASTMTAQLDAWTTYRDSVKPVAGKLPNGTYRAVVTGAQKTAATGHPSDYRLAEFTWLLKDGHWKLSVVIDAGAPDTTEDVYDVTGDELLFRIPTDWKISRTPGVNRLRWTADADGTLHLKQIDDQPAEESFTVPWVRIR
jgi:pimeloyl-ACP methyl ester carboxylesterase